MSNLLTTTSGIGLCRLINSALNLPFSDWEKIFDNTTVATAIADRLVYNSEVIIMEEVSYRKKA